MFDFLSRPMRLFSSPQRQTRATCTPRPARRHEVLRFCLAAVMAVLLAACSTSTPPPPAPPSPTPTPAPTPTATPTPEAETNLEGNQTAIQAANEAEQKARLAARKAAEAAAVAAEASTAARDAAKAAAKAVAAAKHAGAKHHATPKPSGQASASPSPSPTETALPTPQPSPTETVDGGHLEKVQKNLNEVSDRLQGIDRAKLGAADAQKYDIASGLLTSARTALAKSDFMAASSLTEKARVLIEGLGQ